MATTSRDPDAVRNKISKALHAGDIKKALALGQTLIKLPRASAEDCLGMAEIFNRFFDGKSALIATRQAVRRAPNDLNLLFELAQLEIHSGYTKEAKEHLDKAEKLCQTAEDLDSLANIMSRMGDVEAAWKTFQRALEMSPDNLHIKSNFAVASAFLGHIDIAEKLYDEVIAGNKVAGVNYLNRSWLRKQTEDRNHIEELKTAVRTYDNAGPDAPFIYYALAKELEDVERFGEAFDFLEAGAVQRRRQINYTVDSDLAEFESIKQTFDEKFMARNASRGSASEEPIFILGMPRSGSTLIERILGGHSDVFAAGELQNFSRLVRTHLFAAARRQGQFENLDRFGAVSNIDVTALARDYIRSTRPHTGHVARFIDKYPKNFINVGLIAAAFPNAKIIHTRRNPMDACYAMLKQLFLESYNFSYDQKELGAYYLGYRALMDHWDSVLPGRIIHVQYEDLVADNERVSRDLVARLGLGWQDGCLDHTANRDASTTASATQVRQPIYSSSVGKWRHVETQLAPLRETLEAGGLKLD